LRRVCIRLETKLAVISIAVPLEGGY
jgi:hypothetical protein